MNHPANHYTATLDELISLGMDLARLVHSQAHQNAQTQNHDNQPKPDPTIPFERIARAIRRTVRLAEHIANTPDRARREAQHRITARAQIIRAVEDQISRRTHTPESIQAEFLERLEAPELEDDIATRPVPEIIAEICADLGLLNVEGLTKARRRRPEDLRRLRARAAGNAHPARPTPDTGPEPPPAPLALRKS